jgi:hypothetical protein
VRHLQGVVGRPAVERAEAEAPVAAVGAQLVRVESVDAAESEPRLAVAGRKVGLHRGNHAPVTGGVLALAREHRPVGDCVQVGLARVVAALRPHVRHVEDDARPQVPLHARGVAVDRGDLLVLEVAHHVALHGDDVAPRRVLERREVAQAQGGLGDGRRVRDGVRDAVGVHPVEGHPEAAAHDHPAVAVDVPGEAQTGAPEDRGGLEAALGIAVLGPAQTVQEVPRVRHDRVQVGGGPRVLERGGGGDSGVDRPRDARRAQAHRPVEPHRPRGVVEVRVEDAEPVLLVVDRLVVRDPEPEVERETRPHLPGVLDVTLDALVEPVARDLLLRLRVAVEDAEERVRVGVPGVLGMGGVVREDDVRLRARKRSAGCWRAGSRGRP